MKSLRFPERRPALFSFLILLQLLLINAAGVGVARGMGLPPTSLVVYSELALALVLVVIVSKLRWWGEIGFRKPARLRSLWLFLPALALFVGNLTFGIHITQVSALLSFAVLAAASGFVEEVVFRGLMLRSLLPRGDWTAVWVTTAIFGFAHAGNVLVGSDPVYVIVQIGYALAIGFGFGAMAVKGRLIWPLVIAHALGNFVGFINTGDTGQVTGSQVNPHFVIVSVLYIVLFTGYGLYLMRAHPGKGVQRST